MHDSTIRGTSDRRPSVWQEVIIGGLFGDHWAVHVKLAWCAGAGSIPQTLHVKQPPFRVTGGWKPERMY